MCGSAGGAEYMLFCVDCGEAFHSYCADLPLSTMTPAFRLTWRCTNCKLCEICGIATEDHGNCLVYCGKCVLLIEGLVPGGFYSLSTLLHQILHLTYCAHYFFSFQYLILCVLQYFASTNSKYLYQQSLNTLSLQSYYCL